MKKLIICILCTSSLYSNVIYDIYNDFVNDYVTNNKVTYTSAYTINSVHNAWVLQPPTTLLPATWIHNYFIVEKKVDRFRLEVFQFLFERHQMYYIPSAYNHYVYTLRPDVPTPYWNVQGELRFGMFNLLNEEMYDTAFYPLSAFSKSMNDFLHTPEIKQAIYNDFDLNYLASHPIHTIAPAA